MPDSTLLSALHSIGCWQSPPDPIRLLLAVLLLAGAVLGTRLMVGNRGWVRLVIGLAGLSVLPFALLRFGSDCAIDTEPKEKTIEILERELKKLSTGKSALPKLAATDCTIATSGRSTFEVPNFYAGPEYLTYDAVLRNLQAKACQSQPPVAFAVRNSLGTVETALVIKTPANAPWGLIQGDAKLFAQTATAGDLMLMGISNPDSKSVAQLQSTLGDMQVRATMHLETIHVVTTRSDIRDFADLAGKHVLVPNDSQGSILSAINLLRHNRMPTNGLDATSGGLQQLAKLIDGKADALVITTGAPTPLLQAVGGLPEARRRKLHFVSISQSQLPSVYSLTPVEYPQWQEAAARAPAVRALWVTWDFSVNKTPYFMHRCDQTRQLYKILRSSLPALREDKNAHPAWKTVDLDAPVIGWPVSKC